MKTIIFAIIIIFFSNLSFLSHAQVNVQNQTSKKEKTDEISVLDKLDKILMKRQQEAQKLINEGNKLIKKGKKHKRQDLITKGNIKKEIGEKQLKLIREQTQIKKEEDRSYEW